MPNIGVYYFQFKEDSGQIKKFDSTVIGQINLQSKCYNGKTIVDACLARIKQQLSLQKNIPIEHLMKHIVNFGCYRITTVLKTRGIDNLVRKEINIAYKIKSLITVQNTSTEVMNLGKDYQKILDNAVSNLVGFNIHTGTSESRAMKFDISNKYNIGDIIEIKNSHFNFLMPVEIISLKDDVYFVKTLVSPERQFAISLNQIKKYLGQNKVYLENSKLNFNCSSDFIKDYLRWSCNYYEFGQENFLIDLEFKFNLKLYTKNQIVIIKSQKNNYYIKQYNCQQQLLYIPHWILLKYVCK